MRAMILLIAATIMIDAPAALAQTTGTPNSGAGVQGLPGNKSGPAAKPQQNPSGQSSGVNRGHKQSPRIAWKQIRACTTKTDEVVTK